MNRPRAARPAALSVALALGSVLAAACTTRVGEKELLFPAERPTAPVAEAPDRTNIELPASGGVTLRGWLLHAPGNALQVVYFYGNGETVLNAQQHLGWLALALHADVLALDYRGYGFSDGKPTFPLLIEDALAVVSLGRTLAGTRPLILIGRSLGTAMAIHGAAQLSPAAVVLFAPPTGFDDIAQAIRGQIPWFARWAFRVQPDEPLRALHPQPIEEIAQVKAPLLVVLGTEDQLVVPAAARRMHEAAGSADKARCEVHAGHDRTSPGLPEAQGCLADFLRARGL